MEISHLVQALSTQWSDSALAARDAKARKSEAVVAAVDIMICLDSQRAASRIEQALLWNDTDPQINEYDDEEHYEENDDWYTGDGDEKLDESAYKVGTPTDAWRSGKR